MIENSTEALVHGMARRAPGPPPESDSLDLAAIVSRIASGEHPAISDLYRAVAAPLYSVAQRILRSHACAQEIVCDVFVYVWQNAKTYDAARGSVRAWLNVATRHRAIDRLRSVRRNALFNERLPDDEAVPQHLHPERILVEFEAGMAVHAALSSLPPLRRRLLALAFFDGMTHEEIAACVGLPLGTVKSHVRRGLHAMRASLQRTAAAPSAAISFSRV